MSVDPNIASLDRFIALLSHRKATGNAYDTAIRSVETIARPYWYKTVTNPSDPRWLYRFGEFPRRVREVFENASIEGLGRGAALRHACDSLAALCGDYSRGPRTAYCVAAGGFEMSPRSAMVVIGVLERIEVVRQNLAKGRPTRNLAWCRAELVAAARALMDDIRVLSDALDPSYRIKPEDFDLTDCTAEWISCAA